MHWSLQQEEGITITKETAATEPRPPPQPVSMNDSYVNDTADSDSSMDDDEEEEDDEFDDGGEGNDVVGGNSKMQYEIQFQRPQQGQNASGGGAGSSGPGPAAATSGSFLTMVHH